MAEMIMKYKKTYQKNKKAVWISVLMIAFLSAIIFATTVLSADKLHMKVVYNNSEWNVNNEAPNWYTNKDSVSFIVDLSEEFQGVGGEKGEEPTSPGDSANNPEEPSKPGDESTPENPEDGTESEKPSEPEESDTSAEPTSPEREGTSEEAVESETGEEPVDDEEQENSSTTDSRPVDEGKEQVEKSSDAVGKVEGKPKTEVTKVATETKQTLKKTPTQTSVEENPAKKVPFTVKGIYPFRGEMNTEIKPIINEETNQFEGKFQVTATPTRNLRSEGAFEFEISIPEDNEWGLPGRTGNNSITFKVNRDVTAPEINMTGVKDKEIFVPDRKGRPQTPHIVMTISEANFNPEKLVIQLEKDGEKKNINLIEDHEKKTYTLDVEEDGRYKLFIKVTDRAGNVSEKEITFFINNHGPELTVLANGDEMEEGEFFSKPFDLTLQLKNSLNMKSAQITMKKDGQILESKDIDINDFEFEYEWPEPFSEDGQYTLDIEVEEEPGNNKRRLSSAFTIDSTKPVVRYMQGRDTELIGDMSEEKLVTVKIEERHLDTEKTVVTVEKKNTDGTWEQDLDDTFPDFKGNNGEHQATVHFKTEGTYRIKTTAKDMAGNTTSATSEVFTIDRTPPEIAIVEADGEEVKADYSKEKTVTVQISEKHLKKDETRIIVYEKDEHNRFIESDTIVFPPLEENKSGQFTSELTFKIDGDYRITVRAVDEAGSIVERHSETFTIDRVAPKIDIDGDGVSLNPTGDNKDKLIISNSRVVTLNVEELHFDSDLASITVLHADELDGKFSEVEQDKFSRWSTRGNLHTATRHFVTDGVYKVKVEVTDRAGNNHVVTSLPFVIQTKGPIIKVNGVNNSEHYHNNRETTIEIIGGYLDADEDNTYVTAQKDGKSYDVGQLEFSENKAVLKHTFSEEGIYELTIVAQDMANNQPSTERLDFVIDKTAPKLHISDVVRFSQDKQKVTVTVEEKYYESNQVNFEVKKDGKDITDEVVKGHPEGNNWWKLAAESELTYIFKDDGDYEIHLSATDKAGNEAKSQKAVFTIDADMPKITIKDAHNKPIEHQKHYPNAQDVTVEIKDNNLEEALIEATRDGKVYNIEEDFEEKGNKALLTHTFSKNGEYELKVTAKDKSGNSARETVTFTIDQVDPKISLDHNITNDVTKDYINKLGINQFIKIGVTERHVKSKSVTVTYTDLDGKRETWRGRDVGEWSNPDKNHRYQFKLENGLFNKDGDYQLTVKVEDYAGRATTKSADFTVDNKKPKISLSKINRYNNTGQTVTVTVTEHNYKKNNVKVRVTTPDGVKPEYKWVNEDKTSKLPIAFNHDGTYTLEVEAIDDAGNRAQDAVTFTIDQVKPKLSIRGIDNTDEIKHYRQSKRVTFEVTDKHLDPNNTILSVKKRNRSTGKMENVNVGNMSMSKTKASLTHTFTSEGEYTVELSATDKAGNRAEPKKITFIIDKTAPTLSIDGIKDGAFYPASRQVTVRVNETNYNTNNVQFTVTKNGADITQRVEKKAGGPGWRTARTNSTLQYNFNEDGFYMIQISAKDRAGNVAKTVKKSFIIDTKKPVIDITGVKNGEHYNTNKKVQVMIKDVNFDKNTIRVTRNGQHYSVGGFSITNHRYSDSIASLAHTFSQEGDYEIFVEAIDRAGNREQARMSFTIDKTSPKITPKVKGENRVIKDGEYINRIITPEFVLDESEDKIVSVTLNGGKNIAGKIPVSSKEMAYNYNVVARDKAGNETKLKVSFTIDTTKPKLHIHHLLREPLKGGFFNKKISPIVTYSDKHLDKKRTSVTLNKRPFGGTPRLNNAGDFELSEELKNEGHYTLKAVITDLANNISQQSVHMTLDKTNPKIIFSEPINGKYFNEVIIPEFEIFNELSDYEIIALTLNGEPYELGDPIDKDGKYVLSIEVKDQAGNIARQSFEFIIDMTPPKIEFTGAKDDETYHNPVKVEVSVVNPEDWITSITKNGDVLEGEIIEKTTDGKPTKVRLNFSDIANYNISVEAEDTAGNKGEKSVEFSIAEQSALTKWFENKTVFYGSLVGIFIAVLLAGILLALKRRKDDDSEVGVEEAS
ncbi:MAG TPA: Ig-like domain-containing protein [Cerasibacillus sp.]|uniref:Ig-like domain-containing protein n=1 Tax=Cerasibacillus sp. TaxID=2498711 RepID=UPI002F4043D4